MERPSPPRYRADHRDRYDYGRESWFRLAWQYGFAFIFAVIAMVYGLYFGNQLLKTQREGIESISRIEIFEQEQVYQLRQISERLDRIEARLSQVSSGD